jgi:hypothetical protein
MTAGVPTQYKLGWSYNHGRIEEVRRPWQGVFPDDTDELLRALDFPPEPFAQSEFRSVVAVFKRSPPGAQSYILTAPDGDHLEYAVLFKKGSGYLDKPFFTP